MNQLQLIYLRFVLCNVLFKFLYSTQLTLYTKDKDTSATYTHLQRDTTQFNFEDDYQTGPEQVVETSVTVNDNSPIQDYVHPDDDTQPSYEPTNCCQGLAPQYCYCMRALQHLQICHFITPRELDQKQRYIFN